MHSLTPRCEFGVHSQHVHPKHPPDEEYGNNRPREMNMARRRARAPISCRRRHRLRPLRDRQLGYRCRIQFDPGQAGGLARQIPNVRVTIEGHCDERGTREYNLALGDRRANSAKNYPGQCRRQRRAHQRDQLRQGTSGRDWLGRG